VKAIGVYVQLTNKTDRTISHSPSR